LSLFVDTSVWSLAFRRDAPPASKPVRELARALEAGEGFSGLKDRALIIGRFAALPLLVPDRQDHIDAAELRNRCRRRGVQIRTIDALLAQLCIRHRALKLWSA
jgi:predicted nucleic acid-binding protein